MAFDTFTAVLNAAEFPFISDFFQRSVIIPGIDQPPRIPRSLVGEQSNQNTELAQQYYCQNVMPSSEGLMSVGYEQIVPANVGSTDFDQVLTLRDEDENNFLLSPANGKNYIYTANSGMWVSVSPFVGWTGTIISRSYVNGRTFVCYQRNSIREFDVTANTFDPVIFTFPPGIGIGDIDVIGASNNYLVWASNITVGWSSLIDPTDLVPSINTGAASVIPQDVKGPIRAIVPIAGGYVLYTTKNAVAAFYTNNSRAPFTFREIPNAGGIQNPEQVSQESTDVHYAYTTNGPQKIKINSSEPLDSAAADFLGGRIFESFDLTTLTLTLERLSSDLKVKIAYISGRFLVISYGKQSSPQLYTHAIVFDTSLKRWGKLRIDHVDAFPYPYPNLIGAVTDTPPKRSVAFLQNDGTVKLLLMDYRIKQDQGVLLLGRYKMMRQRTTTFQGILLESSLQAYPPDVYLVLSYDGKNNEVPQRLTLVKDGATVKEYGAPVYSGVGAAPARTGDSFSILSIGKFEFSTAILTVTKQGYR